MIRKEIYYSRSRNIEDKLIRNLIFIKKIFKKVSYKWFRSLKMVMIKSGETISNFKQNDLFWQRW
jgi:hypothetical protein